MPAIQVLPRRQDRPPRSSGTWNSTTPAPGLLVRLRRRAAMEEQKSQGQDISGDHRHQGRPHGAAGRRQRPVFWGQPARFWLPWVQRLAAQSGSIVGPAAVLRRHQPPACAHPLVRSEVRLRARHRDGHRGQRWPAQKITQMAAIMGLFVMGALVSKWTSIRFPAVVSTVRRTTTGSWSDYVSPSSTSCCPAWRRWG